MSWAGSVDLVAVGPGGAVPANGAWAVAARDAFAAQWDGWEVPPKDGGDAYVP